VHWGCDIPEMIEKMGKNIAHVHLNDMQAAVCGQLRL
jgi:sugar phosphate isomerase/epimerase